MIELIFYILLTYLFGVGVNALLVLLLISEHKRTHVVTSVGESFDFKKTLRFILLSWYSFNKALTRFLDA